MGARHSAALGHKVDQRGRQGAAEQTKKKGRSWVPCGGQRPLRVQVAASSLGVNIPGATAYHTSVIVDGTEYSFSASGISIYGGAQSHQPYPGSPKIMDFGWTSVPQKRMLAVLRPQFQPGSYDLLKKNCNTFTDCALNLLVGQQLEAKYRRVEKFARKADAATGVVEAITGGGYQPNPQAADFRTAVVQGHLRKANEAAARRES